MTAVKIPLTQLPHQLPNMLAMATGGLRSYVPLLRGKPGREQSQTMAPPPAALRRALSLATLPLGSSARDARSM